jgi:hypothetical protein
MCSGKGEEVARFGGECLTMECTKDEKNYGREKFRKDESLLAYFQ